MLDESCVLTASCGHVITIFCHPDTFPIDFVFWEPAVKATNGDHMTTRCNSVTEQLQGVVLSSLVQYYHDFECH